MDDYKDEPALKKPTRETQERALKPQGQTSSAPRPDQHQKRQSNQSQKPKRPPAQKSKSQRRVKRPVSLTNRNNLIGLGILALGLVALIWVGFVAYNKFTGASSEASESSEEVASQSDLDAFREAATAPNRATGEGQEVSKESYKRQNSISLSEMSGTWQAALRRGTALMEIRKNTYRLILIPSKTSTRRYYSNGEIEIRDDIVIMKPNIKSPPPASETYRYDNLSRSNIVVMAGKYKGKLVWQNPPNNIRGLYVPTKNIVLMRTKNNVAVWELMK